jgi:hypothetical protein
MHMSRTSIVLTDAETSPIIQMLPSLLHLVPVPEDQPELQPA